WLRPPPSLYPSIPAAPSGQQIPGSNPNTFSTISVIYPSSPHHVSIFQSVQAYIARQTLAQTHFSKRTNPSSRTLRKNAKPLQTLALYACTLVRFNSRSAGGRKQ